MGKYILFQQIAKKDAKSEEVQMGFFFQNGEPALKLNIYNLIDSRCTWPALFLVYDFIIIIISNVLNPDGRLLMLGGKEGVVGFEIK